ncbi:MAG TPA: hypothetical protein VGN09_29585 [Vicinamibacteria bacterium]
MPTSRTKSGRPARASAHHPKPKPKPKPKAGAKAKAKPTPKKTTERLAPKAAHPPSPKPGAAPAPAATKGGAKTAAGTMPPPAGPPRPGAGTAAAKAAGATGKPAGARPSAKKGGRKSPLSQRRGPNGELFQPGDLLLPTGPQGPDEIQYLLRGSVAAEHPAPEAGVSEIVIKKGPEAEGDRGELSRFAMGLAERFDSGTIEPLLPTRPVSRRNFAGVVERAKHRRREIGAFLRGLDLGRTESSHMDSHGEASLQSLMEWAARLENLAEADEPDNADYAQFHRGMDQLENTTEALIVDVELTLRRLRDRVKA